ncbi:MAG: dTMP kinase [Nitrososphaerota archaeon]|nr:dTMP kinase [Nitrososphaerota archaeon]
MSRPLGAFVAIEGVDAVGKMTQTSLLLSHLRAEGLSSRALSFPAYETAIGKEIRRFLAGRVSYPPQARAMLYAANRWEKKAELQEFISKTDAVIVDRYSGSNLAYGISIGLDLKWLMSLESGLPEPDVTLVLDAPLENVMPRRGRGKDSYESNRQLQEKARGAYLRLAAKFGWTVIDADRDIEDVGKSIASIVSTVMEVKRRTI